jgi:hypothetical protein
VKSWRRKKEREKKVTKSLVKKILCQHYAKPQKNFLTDSVLKGNKERDRGGEGTQKLMFS